ncbi:MAG: hypothetical protein KF745_15400 [Phycisphaeraceae bacterium]|nr:hypothetical protein [Phycisphaeraceae bacterium]
MPPAPLGPVRATELLTSPRPPEAPVPGSHTTAIVTLVAIAAVVSVALTFGWNRARRRPPLDTAFRKMCRHLRLGRREQDHLFRLAALPVEGWHGPVPPAALLVSIHAFDRAAQTAADSGEGRVGSFPDPVVVAGIRERIAQAG